MKSKSTLLAIAFMLACLPLASAQAAPSAVTLAPPTHPATEAQIREYLTLTHAIETAHQVMAESLKTSRATSAPYFTASFWEDMEKSVMEIDLVGPFIPAYQKYFSEEDMAVTISFYKSAAGQRLLAAQPFISSAASDVLREAGRKAGEQVGLKHQAEIEELMKKQSSTPAMVLPPDTK